MGFAEEIAALGQGFKEASFGLAMQRATAGATEAVNQIKAAEGDEIQKQAQLRQVSEALTRDLAQFGAPADRIALIANSIAKPKQMYQTAEQALINEAPGSQQYKAAETTIKSERDFKLTEQREKQAGAERLMGIKTAANLQKDERNRYIPGFGLALTPNDAKESKKLLTELDPAKQNLQKLLEMANTPSNRVSPEARARAQALARMTMGNLRMAIIGPGAVSDSERAILESIVADPTEFFRLPAATRERLGTLMGALDRRWKSQLQASGVVSLDGNALVPTATAAPGGAAAPASAAAPQIPGLSRRGQ
jgi:hypothetical protein